MIALLIVTKPPNHGFVVAQSQIPMQMWTGQQNAKTVVCMMVAKQTLVPVVVLALILTWMAMGLMIAKTTVCMMLAQ